MPHETLHDLEEDEWFSPGQSSPEELEAARLRQQEREKESHQRLGRAAIREKAAILPPKPPEMSSNFHPMDS